MIAFNNFRFKSFFLIITFLFALVAPYIVFAQIPGDDLRSTQSPSSETDPLQRVHIISQGTFNTDVGSSGIANIIANALKGFTALLGIVFLILMLYGGYLWMSARGNEQQVEKAQSLIRSAVIGLIIIIAAYAITYFVISWVTGTGGGGGGGSGGQAL
ncbi:MAG: hypothetical protein Q8Q23_05115 [bacterium]|nr:hypothetical protein [bacterium]